MCPVVLIGTTSCNIVGGRIKKTYHWHTSADGNDDISHSWQEEEDQKQQPAPLASVGVDADWQSHIILVAAVDNKSIIVKIF